MKNYIINYKSYIYFILFFSLAFFFVKLFFMYLLPFLIGILLSFLMYPVYIFMKRRLSFKPAFSATVITFFIFSVIIAIISFLAYLLIYEAVNLYYNNVSFFKSIFSENNILDVLGGINLSGEMFSKISNTAFGIVKIIPISITLFIISFAFTIFLLNNLSKIIDMAYNRLSDENKKIFESIINNSRIIIRKFVRSYLVLYLITFVESLFIFILIGLEYPIVFAFLTAVSDLLPILGPGTVYLPIAVIKFFNGDYLSAITLVIFWAIIVIIRQIIEPKIVSGSIKIHPLLILSALYFSIVSSNLWVLFYVILLFLVYKILVEAQVLRPLFFAVSKDNNKEC